MFHFFYQFNLFLPPLKQKFRPKYFYNLKDKIILKKSFCNKLVTHKVLDNILIFLNLMIIILNTIVVDLKILFKIGFVCLINKSFEFHQKHNTDLIEIAIEIMIFNSHSLNAIQIV